MFQSAPTAVPECFLSISSRLSTATSIYLTCERLPGCDLYLHPSEHGSSLSLQLYSPPTSVVGQTYLCFCISTCPCFLPTWAASTACLCCPLVLQVALAFVPDCFSCCSGCNLQQPLAQKVSSDCSVGLHPPLSHTAVDVSTFVSQILCGSSLHLALSRSHRPHHAVSIQHCNVSSLSVIPHAASSICDTSSVSSDNRP